ncbi:MAG: NADPH-dependent 7-cyano-7-deazaguanine reductase QueF [Gammaproteobacteria bacterium]|jgi:7-cyano-7-deazaguanine reductase|nr:NADPH-dependent 7-cyano-7-deazaguanine reductase QueF [Gammaproteobacteria bacterium]
MSPSNPAQASPLGKKTHYVEHYSPELLFPIPRQGKREEIGLSQTLPFYGADIWNAYELSWLNPKGKPIVGIAQIIVPCDSSHIFESKSLKLYLNSLNQARFTNKAELVDIIKQDLSRAAGKAVAVEIWEIEEFPDMTITKLESNCLDKLDISCDTYQTQANFLKTESELTVEESFHSNLLRSNCLVTGQPDWGTLEISYHGKKIDRIGLLRYIVSFRHHIEFHEQCVERIFVDIMQQCQPQSLSVCARYTRRGGIDINPYRSTNPNFKPANIRLSRQ